jgi:hypothetical protein
LVAGPQTRYAVSRPLLVALYFMRTFSELFRKNLLAFLLGPLALIPATIVYAIAFKILEPVANFDQGSVAPLFILFGLTIAYPVTLIIGLPCSILLEKFGKFNLVNLLISSTAIVSIYALVMGGSFLGYLFMLYFAVWVACGCWFFYKAA